MQAIDQLMPAGETIRVRGIVQGVGFRPFVWQLAQRHGLQGRVWNDAEGVLIEAWGAADALERFRHDLRREAPPLARLEAIETRPLAAQSAPTGFHIADSRQGRVATGISPDAASCPQCLAEIRDPGNRRYRYPFTNCTHCGPRLSIIRAIPYDRANTSMADFALCPQCRTEYDDPADRRFHAQPNACPDCGPRAWLEDAGGERLAPAPGVDVIEQAAALLRQGHVLAIKGLGGFHLACDASNDAAVDRLRQRKQRNHKPFALMARDAGVIRRYAELNPAEEVLLQQPAAPIVILRAHATAALAEGVAPGQDRLGFMLPYTPLHSLLLQDIEVPLVMTSGNRSDETQCIYNQQARTQLSGIADYFLLHDRDIVNRLDDSVARIIDGQPQLLRRARGYAPQPLRLPSGFEASPAVLAMGAELKNTFCLLQDGKAVVSQHQGDLEDATVHQDYRHNLDLYRQMFDHRPELIAVDHHPNYLSTGLGLRFAQAEGRHLVKVQHHHAHIAACMAEHSLPLATQTLLGMALDGLGLGDGGSLWGAECLLADYRGYQRLARFEPVAMPGGTRAVIEPWRNAFAHLHHCLGWDRVVRDYPGLDFVTFMRDKPVANLITMQEKGLNSPPASSAGRLFDAVAAVLGICCDAVSYEGQAAMQLETMAEGMFADSHPYPHGLDRNGNDDGLLTVTWTTFWPAMLQDLVDGVPHASIAARFHRTLVAVITSLVERLLQKHGFSHVVLTGGVMQNQLLLEALISELSAQGLQVLIPRQFPANDGGIALGQAVVAGAQVLSD